LRVASPSVVNATAYFGGLTFNIYLPKRSKKCIISCKWAQFDFRGVVHTFIVHRGGSRAMPMLSRRSPRNQALSRPWLRIDRLKRQKSLEKDIYGGKVPTNRVSILLQLEQRLGCMEKARGRNATREQFDPDFILSPASSYCTLDETHTPINSSNMLFQYSQPSARSHLPQPIRLLSISASVSTILPRSSPWAMIRITRP